MLEPVGNAQFRALLDDESLEVSQEILANDGMYSYAPHVYFEVGREALYFIRLALIVAELDVPKSILDLGSGAGRVLRYLKAAFPDASLTACDIHERNVRFCEQVFGATPVVASQDPAEIELEGPFDLIWA